MPIDSVSERRQRAALPKVAVLSGHISLGSFATMVKTIARMASRHQSAYVCCTNVHMLHEAHRDPAFRSVLAAADLSCPDGMPVAQLTSRLYALQQERVAGMDLLPALLVEAEMQKLSVFFLGDTPEVLAQLQARAQADWPGLAVAGTWSPPFRTLSPAEEAGMLAMIREANPHLLFVALGCPKQERWMARYRGEIPAVMLGVGNAFRSYLGLEKRPPRWVQQASLEWLYRLAQNPRRLWKRYVVSNSWFVLHATRALLLRQVRQHT